MDYDDILDTLVTELSERAIKAHRSENSAMDTEIKELVEMSEKIRKFVLNLDEQAQNDFERYINLMNNIAERQQRYLYIQGAKDCAGLLKHLNII